jgi:hypothetical protein
VSIEAKNLHNASIDHAEMTLWVIICRANL